MIRKIERSKTRSDSRDEERRRSVIEWRIGRSQLEKQRVRPPGGLVFGDGDSVTSGDCGATSPGESKRGSSGWLSEGLELRWGIDFRGGRKLGFEF